MKFALPVCLMFVATIFAFGQAQEKVLYSFGGVPNDGLNPVSALVSDSAGNLYGTTEYGGAGQGGAVFELTPQSDGSWSEAVIYSFCPITNCTDGYFPQAGLTIDANGNLYGTTTEGGTGCVNNGSYCGTAFELSPPELPGADWAETIIYNFCTDYQNRLCLDGFDPQSQLILDASGNLYGTTSGGGTGEAVDTFAGIVFKLSPASNGWTETVLYNFCSHPVGKSFCLDGATPIGGVAFDNYGNLYGTSGGGQFNKGLVYELAPGAGGWDETILFNFFGQNGGSVAPVTFDAIGNLYDTTQNNAFQLNAQLQRVRTRNFTSSVGYDSKAGVLIDPIRNVLYGTTSAGGADAAGTAWEVNVQRQLLPIYSFCSQTNCADGGRPSGNLIEDASGNLYGTTPGGGAHGNGVVFEITP